VLPDRGLSEASDEPDRVDGLISRLAAETKCEGSAERLLRSRQITQRIGQQVSGAPQRRAELPAQERTGILRQDQLALHAEAETVAGEGQHGAGAQGMRRRGERGIFRVTHVSLLPSTGRSRA
jgi:hypothetical protein